jgi:hypothetical protein
MKSIILLICFILLGCDKVLIDDKPTENKPGCWTCITTTHDYINNSVRQDSFHVYSDSAFRANNGLGITIGTSEGITLITKWTRCK